MPISAFDFYTGTGTPTISGTDGDVCIRESDGEYFKYQDGEWVDKNYSAKGATGDTGPEGPAGDTGPQGPAGSSGILVTHQGQMTSAHYPSGGNETVYSMDNSGSGLPFTPSVDGICILTMKVQVWTSANDIQTFGLAQGDSGGGDPAPVDGFDAHVVTTTEAGGSVLTEDTIVINVSADTVYYFGIYLNPVASGWNTEGSEQIQTSLTYTVFAS